MWKVTKPCIRSFLKDIKNCLIYEQNEQNQQLTGGFNVNFFEWGCILKLSHKWEDCEIQQKFVCRFFQKNNEVKNRKDRKFFLKTLKNFKILG